MSLFACRGHSASIIKNHSEVKVTPNIIMPFFLRHGVVLSLRAWELEFIL